MDLKEAVKWCVDHRCTVYFNTDNPYEEDALISFGKVQVSFKYPGQCPYSCGGNTLEIAVERAKKAWRERDNKQVQQTTSGCS